jgi:thiol-disulfide isomerase/thioredoxin
MKTRYILAALTAVILLSACQQNSYKISGTSDGLHNGDTLFLTRDLNSGIPSDTIIVKEGTFSVKGETDTCMLTILFSPKNPEVSAMFFTEPGTITIHLGKNADSTIVGGTKANEGLQAMNNIAREYGRKMQEQAALFFDPSASEESKKQAMAKEVELQASLTREIIALAEKNIDNELGYFIVTNFSDDETFTNEKRQELINKMPSNFRQRNEISEILAMIEAASLIAEGKTITDIYLPSTDGTPMNIMSEVAKNQLTVLDFWASWCGPCRQEMPLVVELYNKYHEKGLGIVGISLDEDKDKWVNAISEMGMSWPQMSDLKGWQSAAAQMYQVNSIPFTIVVDQKGTILKKGLRGEDLASFIDEKL